MASLLPATLDEQTVPDLIAYLDRVLYPEPTPGSTARTAILLALAGLCVPSSSLCRSKRARALTSSSSSSSCCTGRCSSSRSISTCTTAARQKAHGAYGSSASSIDPAAGSSSSSASPPPPSSRAAPSSLPHAQADTPPFPYSPRIAWVVTVLTYSAYELVFLVVYWRSYTGGRGQEAWLAVRTFNPMILSLGGWVISWAGLTVRPPPALSSCAQTLTLLHPAGLPRRGRLRAQVRLGSHRQLLVPRRRSSPCRRPDGASIPRAATSCHRS